MSSAHMLWIQDELGLLEQICARSFVRQGFDLTIWSYGNLRNPPSGARLGDAREVLPSERVFRNRRGSFASFADLFRYTLLSRFGGLWADMDVIALKRAADLPSDPFVVTQYSPPVKGRRAMLRRRVAEFVGIPTEHVINTNVIHHPRPRVGDAIDLARALADYYPQGEIEWDELGPRLLTAIARYQPSGLSIRPPEFANPVSWWECPAKLIGPDFRLPSTSSFLHCFNEMWRQAGIDKESAAPRNSLLGRLVREMELV